MNMNSVNKLMKKTITNKYVLYLVFFIAVTNVLGFLSIGDNESVALFVALAVITSYFNKNMVVILAVAIFGTNFIFGSKKLREGFEGKKEKKSKKHKKPKVEEDSDEEEEEEEEKESMATLKPASLNKDDEEDDEVVGDSRIDYASTMEQAYDNLANMLGKGGISSLTKETKSLLEQQKQLAGQLESMAPLLNDAKDLISNMKLPEMGGLDKMMKQLGGFANKSK